MKTYESVGEARQEIGKYIEWHNTKRRRQGLGYIMPLQAVNEAKIPSKPRRARSDGSMSNSNELLTISIEPATTTPSFKQQNKNFGEQLTLATHHQPMPRGVTLLTSFLYFI